MYLHGKAPAIDYCAVGHARNRRNFFARGPVGPKVIASGGVSGVGIAIFGRRSVLRLVEPFGLPCPRATPASQRRGFDSPSGFRAKPPFNPLPLPCGKKTRAIISCCLNFCAPAAGQTEEVSAQARIKKDAESGILSSSTSWIARCRCSVDDLGPEPVCSLITWGESKHGTLISGNAPLRY
jgi:hypothetical protein